MKTLYATDNCKFEYDITTDSFIYTRYTGQGPIIIDRVRFLESFTGTAGEDKFGEYVLDSIPENFQYINKIIKTNPDNDTMGLFRYNVESCNTCGEDSEFLIQLKNKNEFYCYDCFVDLAKCRDCGEFVSKEDSIEIDGESVCNDCIAENYTQCDDCGTYVLTDDALLVYDSRGNEKYVCDDCTRDYNRCDSCGEYYADSYTITTNNTIICRSCYENGDYFTCETCGDIFHVDDMANSDDGCYCESCYEERRPSIINPHWSKFTPIFHGEGPLFFGIEQEIDDGDNPGETAESIIDKTGEDNLYIETDGSLNDNGLELVYFPRSWDSWKEFYPKLDKVRTIARGNSYLSHETTTCGLHVHISRDALKSEDCPSIRENIGKIMFLYEKHFAEFVKFSRRKSSGLSRWAKNNPIGYRESADPMEYYEAAEERGDRYCAVNIQPTKTIEFRFFRGTLLPGTILASIGLCYNLAMLSTSKTQEEIEKIEFMDIINYDNGTNYVKDYWNSRLARLAN